MSRAERRWLAAAVALALIAFNAPHVVGLLRASPESPYTGALFFPADVFSYYAKMRLGAGGEWLFRDRYAVEPHARLPIYLPYLLLGRLAAALAGGGARVPAGALVVVYHAARALLGAALLVQLYRVGALLLSDVTQRRLAWVLLVFGGGVGWLAVLLTGDPLVLGGPYDLYLGEAASLIPLLVLPHVVLGRLAVLSGLLCFVRAVEEGRLRPAVGAGAWWLLAAAAVPFHIVTAGGIVIGWMVARRATGRSFPREMLLPAVVAGLPGALLLAAAYVPTIGDPVYTAWQAQDFRTIGGPLHLLVGYGVQLLLALPGVYLALKNHTPRAPLFAGWMAAPPLLALIPVPVRQRLIEGWFVPLAVLSVYGAARLLAVRGRWVRGAAIGLWGALSLTGAAALLIGALALTAYGDAPAYLDAETAAALGWLRDHAASDAVVLSASETGERLPAYAPVRALLGHAFETPYFAQKEGTVSAFFGGGVDDTVRVDVLERWGVDYVYAGPAEAALTGAGFDPGALPLEVVYSSAYITIYEVTLP
ncbi:MAG: hypothetical protein Kow00124_18600 [Anaerolineae bacterium]